MRFITIVAIFALCSACPADPRASDAHSRAAQVEDAFIHNDDFLRELIWAGVGRNTDADARVKLANAILNQLVEEELLWQQLQKSKIEVDQEDIAREVNRAGHHYPPGIFQQLLKAEQMTEEAYLERVKRGMQISAYVKKNVVQDILISDDELRTRYDASKHKNVQPERVLARQILVKTEEVAQYIYNELRSKRITFEDAIVQYNEHPTGSEGSHLDWFSKGELPSVFDICFTLQPQKHSRVIESKYGFHIFEVIAKRSAGPEPFESAKPRLKHEALREHEEEALLSHIKFLKGETATSIDPIAVERTLKRLSGLIGTAPSANVKGSKDTAGKASAVRPSPQGQRLSKGQ